jgi:hypothetical protein
MPPYTTQAPRRACYLANFIAAQRVPSMNADAHHVTTPNLERVKRLQSFVDEVWVAIFSRSGSGKHIEPARRNYRRSKRHIAGIYQVDLHGRKTPIFCNIINDVRRAA